MALLPSTFLLTRVGTLKREDPPWEASLLRQREATAFSGDIPDVYVTPAVFEEGLRLWELFAQGVTSFRAGSLGEAEQAFLKIVASESSNPDARFYLAWIALSSGDTDRALSWVNGSIGHIEGVIGRVPTSSFLRLKLAAHLVMRAAILAKLGDEVSAFRYFSRGREVLTQAIEWGTKFRQVQEHPDLYVGAARALQILTSWSKHNSPHVWPPAEQQISELLGLLAP